MLNTFNSFPYITSGITVKSKMQNNVYLEYTQTKQQQEPKL